jgi:hypothetical protein
MFDKILVAKFGARNVNGDALEWEARCLPFARRSTCFTQHPAAYGENEATIFGDGNELGGWNQSAIRLLPADQGLDARDLTGDKIYLGLIVQQELIALDGAAQAAFKRLPLHRSEVHFRGEELEIVAAVFLGVVHGGVGILYERFRILAIGRIDADTNAAVDVQVVPVNGAGKTERMKYFICTGGWVISESKMTNSSPPCRLTVSEPRTLACKRSETHCRSWSPMAWPNDR